MDDGWGDRPEDYPHDMAYRSVRRDMEERAAAQSRAGANLVFAFALSVIGWLALLIWWFSQ